MQLEAGDALGPYVVLDPAGSGGMGEVYKARDTRLNRVVALKVIGTSQAASPESRKQFAAEALAIAALNHPHICALYDTGHALGRDFLVFEYLEGETLAQRLRRAPLQPRETLDYAIEIAEALDYAHRQNIIHRDLKPANVSAQPFERRQAAGLWPGKFASDQHPPRTAFQAAPLSRSRPLRTACLLGTLHYMAPELFDGQPADARSDVFAFGTMFYEMITNRQAFDEKSAARLMAAILSKEPPPIDAASGMSPEFDWIVQSCLAKDPDDRWQSMGDVAKVLKGITRTTRLPVSGAAGRRRQRIWFGAGAAVATMAALAGTFALRPSVDPGTSALHGTFTGAVLPPRGSAFALTDSSVKSAQFAVAPDGRSLVFVATTAGVRALWLQELRSTGGTAAARHERRVVSFLVTRRAVRRVFRRRLPQEGEPGRALATDSVSSGERPRRCVELRRQDRVCCGRGSVALDCECDRRGAQSVHQKGRASPRAPLAAGAA